MKSNFLGLIAVVVLLCVGCMVGPDYRRPSAPMTAAYKEDQGWKLARPGDDIPRGRWWEIFGDPQLNALEEQVSEANQNIKVAEARFRQARALIGSARAGLFPTLSAGFSADSVRGSTGSTSTHDFLSTGDVSYELDLWGRIRRGVTAAREEAPNRRRRGDSEAKPSGGTCDGLFRAAQRRCATTASR
jgi:outer membrane protein TolC